LRCTRCRPWDPDVACHDEGLLTQPVARDETIELGERHGYRNAQATVLAPTGTISFLMDCETTGVSPTSRWSSSRSSFARTDDDRQRTVRWRCRRSLLRRGIDQIDAYLAEHGTIVGAPGLAEEHLPSSTCGRQRAISHMGHLKMMGACSRS